MSFFIKPVTVNIKLSEEFGHESSELTELIKSHLCIETDQKLQVFIIHHVTFRYLSHVHHTEPVMLLCLGRAF